MGFRLVQILVRVVLAVLVFLSPNFPANMCVCISVCHFPSLWRKVAAVWMISLFHFPGELESFWNFNHDTVG